MFGVFLANYSASGLTDYASEHFYASKPKLWFTLNADTQRTAFLQASLKPVQPDLRKQPQQTPPDAQRPHCLNSAISSVAITIRPTSS